MNLLGDRNDRERAALHALIERGATLNTFDSQGELDRKLAKLMQIEAWAKTQPREIRDAYLHEVRWQRSRASEVRSRIARDARFKTVDGRFPRPPA